MIRHATFSQIHKIGTSGINASLVFLQIRNFLHCLDHMTLVNLKLDIFVG